MKMTPYSLAGFYAELGNKDRAFAALNEAVDKADQFYWLHENRSLHETAARRPALSTGAEASRLSELI